ncbi:MAG: RloB family protein [Prevotellaceae bacterium]|jgi:hypothetical protein|nr:RloB family protein [Prevotellaceae bacterium]
MATKGKINKLPLRDTEERPVRWRKYKCLILIVCEDEKTEPYYFTSIKNQLPNETVFLRPVGTGRNSKGVVEQAIIEKQKLLEESNKNVDDIWAVFDRDDADKSESNRERFAKAFEIADKSNIKVAYSNEVFELWLLLHFSDVSSEIPMPRRDIYSALENSINKGRTTATKFTYSHGDTQVIDIVLASGNESEAIKRAEKLDEIHRKIGKKPIDANPNTLVYQLVKKLRALIDYYA